MIEPLYPRPAGERRGRHVFAEGLSAHAGSVAETGRSDSFDACSGHV